MYSHSLVFPPKAPFRGRLDCAPRRLHELAFTRPAPGLIDRFPSITPITFSPTLNTQSRLKCSLPCVSSLVSTPQASASIDTSHARPRTEPAARYVLRRCSHRLETIRRSALDVRGMQEVPARFLPAARIARASPRAMIDNRSNASIDRLVGRIRASPHLNVLPAFTYSTQSPPPMPRCPPCAPPV